MLEAGSSTRVRNKGGLTPYQLVDPRNTALRDLIQKHEYASLNTGDFVQADDVVGGVKGQVIGMADGGPAGPGDGQSSDEDAEFSGSDDEERAEWERRRRERRAKKS